MTQKLPVREEGTGKKGSGMERHFEREAIMKAANMEVRDVKVEDPPTDSSQDNQKIQD